MTDENEQLYWEELTNTCTEIVEGVQCNCNPGALPTPSFEGQFLDTACIPP